MTESRQTQYKNMGKDSDTLRKNRVENIVSIRKDKREETLSKRRNIPAEWVVLCSLLSWRYEILLAFGMFRHSCTVLIRFDAQWMFNAAFEKLRTLNVGLSPPIFCLGCSGKKVHVSVTVWATGRSHMIERQSCENCALTAIFLCLTKRPLLDRPTKSTDPPF